MKPVAADSPQISLHEAEPDPELAREPAVVARVDVTVLSKASPTSAVFLLEPAIPSPAAPTTVVGARQAGEAPASPRTPVASPAATSAAGAKATPIASASAGAKAAVSAAPAKPVQAPSAKPAAAGKAPATGTESPSPKAETQTPQAAADGKAADVPSEPLSPLWPELPATPPSSAPSLDPASQPPETKVGAAQGERLELRFPGSGWIYLGDEEGREGVKYGARRYENGEVVFSLDPASPGEYLLKFQRQNPVDGLTDVSFVRLEVARRSVFDPTGKAPAAGSATDPGLASSIVAAPGSGGPQSAVSARPTGSATKAAAPVGTPAAAPAAPASAASVAPGSAAATQAAGTPTAGSVSAAGAATAIPAASTAPSPASAPTAPGTPTLGSAPAAGAATSVQAPAAPALPADPAALVDFAKAELAAKRAANAILALDRAAEAKAAADDELAFLYGAAYEADSPARDVRRAYGYYRHVRDEFPRSLRWKEAADRIAYLERHYLGLR